MQASSRQNFLCASIALAALTCPSFAQQVWTVGPDAGADFPEIQDAIDAAFEGDVILVEAGAYGPIRIDGKGLRIHGVSGVVTVFNQPVGGVEQPAIRVRGLEFSQSVLFDRIDVVTTLPLASSGVEVAGCEGPVWYQRGFVDSYGGPSLHVMDSTSVVVSDSLMQTNLATPGPLGEPEPAAGALVEGGSQLFAYQTDFVGSHGAFVVSGAPALAAPLVGGDGITVIDSTVVMRGGSAKGGSGSTFFSGGCGAGTDGGAGVRLLSTGLQQPLLRFTEPVLAGGAAGFSQPCAPPASAGPQIEPGSGDVIDTFQEARAVTFDGGAVSPGEKLTVVGEGKPGDLVFVLAGTGAFPAITTPTGFLFGEVDLHITYIPLVVIESTSIAFGSSVVTEFTVPPPTPGLPYVTPALQGLVLDGTTLFPHLCAPSAVTILAQ